MVQLGPAVVITAVGLSSLLAAGCSDAGGDCTGGHEGCACVESKCLDGLVCGLDNICVSLDDTDGGSQDVTASATNGGTPGGDTDGGGSDGESDSAFTSATITATDSDSDSGQPGCEDNSPPAIDAADVQGVAIAAEEDDVRVTITVSDPDGVADVESARIELPDGSSLKSMGKTSQDTFAAEIDWFYDIDYGYVGDDIPLDSLIEFQIAVSDGCETTRVPLELTVCEGDGDSFCSGACVDTQDNDNACGSCDNACNSDEYCDFGMCTEDYDYALPSEPPPEEAHAGAPIALPDEDVPLSFGQPAPSASPVDVDPFTL